MEDHPREETANASGLPVRVADLRQLLYCERIPALTHWMDHWPRETYKQKEGTIQQAALERLETRRSLQRYGLADGRREFHVRLESARLGLRGIADMVVTTAAGVFPVEFKLTRSGVRHSHRVQLAAYAMMLEERDSLPVERGFVYLIPTQEVESVTVGGELRAAVLRNVARVRELVVGSALPPPPSRAKCTECEFRNYCGDVW